MVTITSQWVHDNDLESGLKNAAAFRSRKSFVSKNDPRQWVCWDFRDMRARPTHHTRRTFELKPWVVEGSLDGGCWGEMDRQTGNQDFNAK
jgi:hypothetical protein